MPQIVYQSGYRVCFVTKSTRTHEKTKMMKKVERNIFPMAQDNIAEVENRKGWAGPWPKESWLCPKLDPDPWESFGSTTGNRPQIPPGLALTPDLPSLGPTPDPGTPPLRVLWPDSHYSPDPPPLISQTETSRGMPIVPLHYRLPRHSAEFKQKRPLKIIMRCECKFNLKKRCRKTSSSDFPSELQNTLVQGDIYDTTNGAHATAHPSLAQKCQHDGFFSTQQPRISVFTHNEPTSLTVEPFYVWKQSFELFLHK